MTDMHPVPFMLFAEARRRDISVRRLAYMSAVSEHALERAKRGFGIKIADAILALNALGLRPVLARGDGHTAPIFVDADATTYIEDVEPLAQVMGARILVDYLQ